MEAEEKIVRGREMQKGIITAFPREPDRVSVSTPYGTFPFLNMSSFGVRRSGRSPEGDRNCPASGARRETDRERLMMH